MAEAVKLNQIKDLRDSTGVGIMEAKRALTEAKGDVNKARELLKKWGVQNLAKRADKATDAGRVYAYVHPGNQVGALVAVLSETDFVAKSEEFASLCKELCLQIAAMAPKTLNQLLKQPYVRDPQKTMGELITEYSVRFKEKIIIRAFERFAIS